MHLMNVNQSSLLSEAEKLMCRVGINPPVKLDHPRQNLFAKLEFSPFMGSIKDRPALYIMKKAIEDGLVHKDSTVIESSSGNFALALAGICMKLGIKFIPVIDPNILPEKEQLLKLLSHRIIKVDELDHSGAYLLTRLATVKRNVQEIPHCFNPNQYENPNNYMAYYHTLGKDMADYFDRLDYLFVSVSSGGTITGLSKRLKEKFPHLRVVAVDVKGSLIFRNTPGRRLIPGMGSGMRTAFFEHALIDDVVMLSEEDIIKGCHELLNRHSVFAGGSSGAAYLAAKQYLQQDGRTDLNALFICPDKGNTYLNTVYNPQWVKDNYEKKAYEILK